MLKQDGDKLIFQKGGNLTSWVMGAAVFILPGAFTIYAACTIGPKPHAMGVAFGGAWLLAGVYALISMQRVVISEQDVILCKRSFLGQRSTTYSFQDLKKAQITRRRKTTNSSTITSYNLGLSFKDGQLAWVIESSDLQYVRQVAKLVVDRVGAEFQDCAE